MGTTGFHLSHDRAGVVGRYLIPLIVTLSLIASQLVFVGFAPAHAGTIGNVSNDLDQWANGRPGTDKSDGNWRNGNLNANNSQYSEGDSVVFRREMKGLLVEEVDTPTYRVTINYDTINNGLVAYDHLTSRDRSDPEADPLAGKSGYGATTEDRHEIPLDPRLGSTPGFTGAIPPQREMSAWGAEIRWIGNYRYSDGQGAGTAYSPNGSTTVSVDVIFEATQPNVILAWGGHLARQVDWNAGAGYDTAPRNTNGSPYHMRNAGEVRQLEPDATAVQDWGSVASSNAGNQDRSIKASAILVPGLNLSKGVLAPGSFERDGDGNIIVGSGDELTYTLTVTNDGESSSELTSIAVSDAVPDIFRIDGVSGPDGVVCSADGQDVTCTIPSLDGGDSVQIEIDVTVVLDLDADPPLLCGIHENHATATSGDLSAADSFAVRVAGCAPALDIVKRAIDADGDLLAPDADGDLPGVRLGEAFTYEVEVGNGTQATDIARDVTITDEVTAGLDVVGTPTWQVFDAAGDALRSGGCILADGTDGTLVTCAVGDLKPGESALATIDVSVPVAADSCVAQRNVAAASAQDSDGNDASVTLPDDDAVLVAIEGCQTDVTGDKTLVSPEGGTIPAVDGEQASFEVSVANHADATLTATGVTITDVVDDALVVQRPVTYVLTDASDEPVSSGDCGGTGQTVQCGGDDGFELPPGWTVTATIDTVLDVSQLSLTDGDRCGTVDNTATFTADGQVVDPASDAVEVVGCASAVQFSKDADVDQVALGSEDTITYTLTAENGQDATSVARVKITDTVPEVFTIGSVEGDDCDVVGRDVACGPYDLAPGESVTVTIEVSLDGDPDASQCGPWTNQAAADWFATAPGSDDAGTVGDDVTVDVVGCIADIELVKSAVASLDADGLVVDEVVQLEGVDGAKQLLLVDGDDEVVEIAYVFEVRNTGNVTLHDVTVEDPLLGGSVDLLATTLAPGGTTIGTAVYTVDRVLDAQAGEIVNVATATAVTDDDDEVSDTDQDVVDILTVSPAISVVKTADVEVGDDGLQVITVDQGETATVTYDYLVTNEGDETLTDLSLKDDKLPEVDLAAALQEAASAAFPDLAAEIGAPALPAGGSVTVSADYTLTAEDIEAGEVTNVALAGGVGIDSGRAVDDDDTVTVAIVEVLPLVLEPGLEIVKEALVDEGDDGLKVVEFGPDDDEVTVTYRFTITNTGTSLIEDLVLVDDKIGEIALPGTSIAPGERMVVEADYTITQADLDAGFVVNVGTVSGVDEDGRDISADDDERVDIVEVLAEIEVPAETEVVAEVEELPRTGVDSWMLLALGSLLAALGAAVLLFTPRRRIT